MITSRHETLSRKFFRECVLEKAQLSNETIEEILNYIFKFKESVKY